MKRIIRNIQYSLKSAVPILAKGLVLASAPALILTSCTDTIEIRRGEDFSLSVLPYRQTLSRGDTRELFFEITTESSWSGTAYNIRYGQTEGEGTLRISDGRTMRENRECLLSEKEFTLLYTSASDSDHVFTVTVSDNCGHSHSVKIELAKK